MANNMQRGTSSRCKHKNLKKKVQSMESKHTMCVNTCPKGNKPKLDKQFIKPENTKQQVNPQEKQQVSIAQQQGCPPQQ